MTMEESPEILIEVNDNLMVLNYVGMFSITDVERVLAKAAARLRVPGARWRVLSDFSEFRLAEAQGEKLVVEFSRENIPYVERSAVIGLKGLKSFIFDAVVRVTGRRANLRRFDTREEAEHWLRSPSEE